jgi:hypothetical protein
MGGTYQREISDEKWPYSYRASQYQNGMWTVTVTRSTSHRYDSKQDSETHTYTSPRCPPSPKAAWREAGGSGPTSDEVAGRALISGSHIVLWIIVAIVVLVVLFWVAVAIAASHQAPAGP